jgi:hypothetical protein
MVKLLDMGFEALMRFVLAMYEERVYFASFHSLGKNFQIKI